MDFSKLKFRGKSSQPLYSQLVSALEGAIGDGELAIGVRLPSERAMAAQLGLSRTTVMSAYRELEARGLIRGHVGKGTFVCAINDSDGAPFAWRGKVSRAASLQDQTAPRHLSLDTNRENLISFAHGCPAIDIFPRNIWLDLVEKALKDGSQDVLSNGPTMGLPHLRRAIAERFGLRSERVLILSGSQQGLGLVSRCLIDPGDAVIVDRPCYIGAIQNFRAAGAHLIGWDIARANMDELEDLILRYRPKLIFTNPTFQNPTGRVLTLKERKELLRLAVRYRTPVLEDDPYRETYFDEPPPPSLQQLDEHNIVIYLSTFSKTLAPGLRLGWLSASEYVIDQLARIKRRETLYSEGIGQYALARFLQRGFFDDHLARLRVEHARRQQAFQDATKLHLPPRLLKFSLPSGGLYFWCRIQNSLNPIEWSQAALAKGVNFISGEAFYADAVACQEARFCYASTPVEKINEGVRRLAGALTTRVEAASHQPADIPLV